MVVPRRLSYGVHFVDKLIAEATACHVLPSPLLSAGGCGEKPHAFHVSVGESKTLR